MAVIKRGFMGDGSEKQAAHQYALPILLHMIKLALLQMTVIMPRMLILN